MAGAFGLIGSVTLDTIHLPSGKTRRSLGGILYQAATLCGLKKKPLLIANVSEEIRGKVLETIRSWPGLRKEGITWVPGPGHEVVLYYQRRGERREKLKSAVRPLSANQVLSHLPGLGFLMVVFNSGFEFDLITWRQIVASCSFPVWVDLHSLVLSANYGVRRYESFPSWPSWVEGITYLQANAREAACLLSHPGEEATQQELLDLTARCLSLGVKAVFITLGKKGVLVASKEGTEVIPAPLPKKVVDTTGCGDCFAAATAAKLRHGASVKEAASFGLRVASRVAGVSGVRAAFGLARHLAQP